MHGRSQHNCQRHNLQAPAAAAATAGRRRRGRVAASAARQRSAGQHRQRAVVHGRRLLTISEARGRCVAAQCTSGLLWWVRARQGGCAGPPEGWCQRSVRGTAIVACFAFAARPSLMGNERLQNCNKGSIPGFTVVWGGEP